MTDLWGNAFSQLTQGTAAPESVGRLNPRPAGVVRRGSASHLIFEFLAECPGRWFEAGQIIKFTGLSRPSASWALIYLTRQGYIHATADDARNPQYLKYTAGGVHVQISECSSEKGAQRLVRDEAALPAVDAPGMAAIRRRWDRDLPAVGELRSVPSGHGPSANVGELARTQGRQQPLHGEQLSLDNGRRADAPPTVLPPSAPQGWPSPDGRRGVPDSGDAGMECAQEPVDAGVRSEPATTAQALPSLDVGHLAGGDAPDTRMGPQAGDFALIPLEPSEQWHASGAGHEPWRHAETPEIFNLKQEIP
jgi:hypothetical protein